jgi:dTDP-4-dehydrorhamnose 3,5-epimerase
LRWDDPDIAIDWPLAAGKVPVLSDKDGNGLSLHEAPLYS